MGKKSDPPPPPDYAAIAKQQAELNKASAEQQTTANRPNQNTPWGSIAWQQGPTSDNWTENVTLNPADQAALDQQRQFGAQKQGIASGLLDKAGTSLGSPINLGGLPALKDYDFSKMGDWGKLTSEGLPARGDASTLNSGFGGVQEVQDAMMGRLAPARAQLRDAEIQRLKNQGLTEGSAAFDAGMKRLDQGDTDANQQALLASMGAYGDIFNRGLAKSNAMDSERQQAFGERGSEAGFANTLRGQQTDEQARATQLAGILRQQSLAEQQQLRQSPLDDFMKLTAGINPTMPQMPSFMGATGAPAADIYGASKDQYQAAMDGFNAQQKQGAGVMGGLFGLAGSALGGPLGGVLGKALIPGG